MKDIVWINWRETCRRSREFCSYFNIKPIVLQSAHYGKLGLLELIVGTISYLNRNRPCVLITTSLRIALLAILLRPIFRYKLVVDCHYSGIIPNPSILSFLHILFPYIHKNADLIIVTNKHHADLVRNCGGKPFVLQDRIPPPPPVASAGNHSGFRNVVYICSYNDDEPIEEILAAVALLDQKNIRFFFTGDNRGKFRTDELPENVVLTGYLPDEKYWQLLWGADLLIDLTTRQNCLLCGAYEAVAVGSPMVLSNSSALKDYFTKGVVFTENRGSAIANSINIALDSHDMLSLQVAELKSELMFNWEPLGEALRMELKELCVQAKECYSKM